MPQTDIRFILCLIISSLVPRSVFVEMLRPNRPDQGQFGIHMQHHVTSANHHPHHQPSELLKKLAFLGKYWRVAPRGHYEGYPTMHYFGIPTHTQSMKAL